MMDIAAVNADKMARRILPGRPHILTLTLDRTFPNPKGFWFTAGSAPIQYMTYLSDAQRGILHTRAAYEMLEDPEAKKAPLTVQDLAKETAGKKKVSAKDYLSRRRSPSPVDADMVGKADARLHNGADAKRDKSTAQPLEKQRPEHREKERPADASRPEKPRRDSDADRIRNPLSRTDPTTTSSTAKKRFADESDHVPPIKRNKPDAHNSKESIRAAPLPDTLRARDSFPEKTGHKDSKSDKLHPTTNGRPHKELEREREYTASPKSTIQVNGTKSHTPTPRKGDSSKVPALLSPLHPSFDRELDDHERAKPRLAEKAPAKRAEAPPKKRIKLPELLSPTLPPIVEAELARVKLTPTQGDSSQRSTDAYDSPSSGKKSKYPDEEEQPQLPVRKMVTLKLRKGAAKRAKELLSLPSKSLKEALKKERSLSVEGTPPPARKRPRIADEVPAEVPSSKRSKTATEALKSVATPNTPHKHTSTSMSRVTSSQSQSATPSNSHGLTPGTAERPPTSSDNHPPVDLGKSRVKVEALRERHDEYRVLGGRLKHTRDDILRERGSTMNAAEQKRAAALHFEMILAYMVSFNAFNQSRAIERKVWDLNFWESLLPHMRELKQRVRHSTALLALAHQMHAVCLEEISHAYATLDPASAASSLQRWSQYERQRGATWEEAMRRCDDVESRSMKVVVGPWTNVDDAVASALSIMCRWAERERVEWQPSGRMTRVMDLLKEKPERVRAGSANGGNRH
ncbi:hypothetical protein GQ53DRAFT_80534 [Thozetella sp. PMI_491]|nr:hypothetical protein GQ53DRAFT_80534 [Thozetella sp. PMI_491]